MNEPSEQADRAAKAVIGCAIEVHRELGPGYLESTYEAALALEMISRGITFVRQPAVEVSYKGSPVGQNRLDFLVDGCLIVELKAVDQFSPIHVAQVVSYLKAMNLQLGLLLNFNVRVLSPGGVRRVVRS